MATSPGPAGGPVPAILAYCGSSIIMTVTNKTILTSYDFRMNFMVLAVQSIATVALLEITTYLKWTGHRPYRHSDARAWLPISLALVAMIYTGSRALKALPIAVFTIFKNLTIVLIAYGERWWFDGAKVSGYILLSFILMVFSSIVAGWSNLLEEKESSPGVGYFWMMANCLTTAFYALVMRARIKAVGFRDYDTVFYNNLLSIPVLLVCSLVLERGEWERSVVRFGTEGEDRAAFPMLVLSLIISGISAFAISYGSAWCVRVTSSTTYSMVGALNKLPIAVAGMLFFGDAVTIPGVLAILIAFSAGLLYAWSKARQAEQMRTLLPAPASAKKAGGEEGSSLVIFDAAEIDADEKRLA